MNNINNYFSVPGTPATTMDFSNTATYLVKELREAPGSELPLIDPTTGDFLLESTSGTNYTVPIPGAIWL